MKTVRVILAVIGIILLLTACKKDAQLCQNCGAEISSGETCEDCAVLNQNNKEDATTVTEENTTATEDTTHKHTFLDGTCTKPGICECGTVAEAASGHNYRAEQTAPTCTTAGYTTYVCKCGDSYVANHISAGHKYQGYVCTLCKQIDPENILKYLLEHEAVYYSELEQAVYDVHADAVGTHADAEKNNAVAGVFVAEDGVHVALLKDTHVARTISLSTNMLLDLGGHVLSTDGKTAIIIEGGVTVVDGRPAGSAIKVNGSDGCSAIVQNNGISNICGGEYIVQGANNGIGIKLNDGSMGIHSAKITVTGTGTVYGIAIQRGSVTGAENTVISATGTDTTYGVYAEGDFSVSHTTVTALSDGVKSKALYVTVAGRGTVSECTFNGLCVPYQEICGTVLEF